jgi:hypothetical protein
MNGRLYDPELGRMLSPDPYVQVPEYSQNFNRYSYVLNNPLNLTDPTGFNWFGKAMSWLKTNWRTVVVIVVAAILVCTGIGATIALGIYGALGGGVVAATSLAGYVITGAFIGAVTGGLGAALNGGNLGDVLRGAVIGGISGALTGALHGTSTMVNIAGHGVVGGTSNVAMGGKFGDGFLSAAASAAAAQSGIASPDAGTIGSEIGIAGRTAIASIAGGTASALGGGKFANGAITGAMTHLLNAEATKLKKALFIGHDMKNGVGGSENSYNEMIENARRAGYEVHRNAFLNSVTGAWESREYEEIVYYNHGSPSGNLAYDIPAPDNGGYKIQSTGLNKIFDLAKGFSSKLTIVSCYYDKVTKPFVEPYKIQGVNIATLPIHQETTRQVFIINGNPADAPPGYILRGNTLDGLNSYFQSQKR